MNLGRVYEPDEDTYTLIDALQAHASDLEGKVVVEIGCGSGEVLRFLSQSVPQSVLIGTDITPDALAMSQGRVPGASFVSADLLHGLDQQRIDVVIFNPPYVETQDEALTGIATSYAGGKNGRATIDRFVQDISVPTVFLLVIMRNDPRAVVASLQQRGYVVEIVRTCRVLCETLVVIRATLAFPAH